MSILQHPPLQPANFGRAIEARVPFKAMRDVINRIRFGQSAPLSDECLFIDPRLVKAAYRANPRKGAPRFRRAHSGQVRGGNWDLSLRELQNNAKYQACIAHFREGVPWEDTGLFELLLERIKKFGHADECRTLDDIRKRYSALDRLADRVRATGRLNTRAELQDSYFRREHGGILIHIDRHGQAIRSGGGNHRFAMARALGLPEIPVQIGVVHKDALDTGLLNVYRYSRHE